MNKHVTWDEDYNLTRTKSWATWNARKKT